LSLETTNPDWTGRVEGARYHLSSRWSFQGRHLWTHNKGRDTGNRSWEKNARI